MYRSLALAAASAVLSAQLAFAADLPTKAPMAPAPMMPPVYNWTGFYIGGQVGGGWAKDTVTHVDGGANFPAGFVQGSINPSGILGGAYGGFNYQWGQFVLGIDGDYSWADLTGSGNDASPLIAGRVAQHSDKFSWVASVTGRLGYAMNNWMLFVKGGGAWAGRDGNSVITNAAGTTINTTSSSDTRDGWIVGGGVEYGFLPHWTAKLEYDYIGFGTANFNATTITAATGAVTTAGRSANSHLNIAKIGVAYKF
jgi:outer membrane immunogenic protein